MNSRLPDFFIVGAAKSGTTSLWKYLGQHPHIFMTEDIGAKELGYFCYHYGVKKLDHYLSYFQGATHEQLIGESCHAYLSSPESAELIFKDIPSARIIMVLRNPVDRAYSLYNWMASNGYEHALTFEQALELEPGRKADERFKTRNPQGFYMNYLYRESGLYSEQIKRYFTRFGKENNSVVFFDELKKNPAEQVRGICRFLGIHEFNPTTEIHNEGQQVKSVGRQFYLRMEFPGKLQRFGFSRRSSHWLADRLMRLNISRGKPKPMAAEIRKTLIDYFASDIIETGKLLNKDLSHWLK